MKHSGYIAAYNAARGFGFVHGLDANRKLTRYYFHVTWVITGDPKTGLPVEFVAGTNEKGFIAVDIEVGGAA